MTMIALIDRPDLKRSVRDDLVDQYEVCPECNGYPYRWACVGGDRYGGWSLHQQYRACGYCDAGIRRKSAPLTKGDSD